MKIAGENQEGSPMEATKSNKPVVFACAGCSLAGRAAYDVALELDRRGEAEMSCLAGLAARKKPFLKKIENRPVWVVDGCPIECAKGVLDGVDRAADAHIRLDELNVRKQQGLPHGVTLEILTDQAIEQATAGPLHA
jgi:uncharacterized metal-binding protein